MLKNKKKFIKVIIFFVLTSVLAGTIFFVVKFLAKKTYSKTDQFFTPKNIEFKIENSYSEKISNKLKNYLQQNTSNLKLLNFDAEKFCKDLKSKFKIIKSVEWDFSNPENIKLNIKLLSPNYLVNEKFVLGDKKRLFDLSFFENFDLKNLKKVNISNNFLSEKIDEQVYNFLNNVPEKIWQNYILSYQNKYKILLKDRRSFLPFTFYLLVTSDLSFFDSEKNICNIDKIFAYYLPQTLNKTSKNKFKVIMLDLRFKNRIFIRALRDEKLGGDNG